MFPLFLAVVAAADASVLIAGGLLLTIPAVRTSVNRLLSGFSSSSHPKADPQRHLTPPEVIITQPTPLVAVIPATALAPVPSPSESAESSTPAEAPKEERKPLVVHDEEVVPAATVEDERPEEVPVTPSSVPEATSVPRPDDFDLAASTSSEQFVSLSAADVAEIVHPLSPVMEETPIEHKTEEAPTEPAARSDSPAPVEESAPAVDAKPPTDEAAPKMSGETAVEDRVPVKGRSTTPENKVRTEDLNASPTKKLWRRISTGSHRTPTTKSASSASDTESVEAPKGGSPSRSSTMKSIRAALNPRRSSVRA